MLLSGEENSVGVEGDAGVGAGCELRDERPHLPRTEQHELRALGKAVGTAERSQRVIDWRGSDDDGRELRFKDGAGYPRGVRLLCGE
jgi:hypothetical protein